jgi:predicted acylesterase/phospholipase RssA
MTFPSSFGQERQMTSTSTSEIPATPAKQCDVVMKGGITSGVVYPKALSNIGASYRFRGVGGASAGAIGAAIGAAAEFGRSSGGFELMAKLPGQLGDGRLAALFQPQATTRPLLRLMLIATAHDRPGAPRKGLGKYAALIPALLAAFPLASLGGLAPGLALAVYGAVILGTPGILLIIVGVLLAIVGWVAALGVSLTRKLTVDVPANLFGICRGLGADADHPGFTDWLSDQIDTVAGLPQDARPLCFGQLWTGDVNLASAGPAGIDPADRHIDLRMISTCLSQGRPYELPWQARTFFYDPQTWRTLFPGYVVDALLAAPPPDPLPGEGDADEWRWEERVAQARTPALARLPDPAFLPVIVATRLSLSFPLLISAIPLWTIDRGSPQTRQATQAFRNARNQSGPPGGGPEFRRLWFTDGGLCSNFPVHLFDAALASRPTFAINLGPFPPGKTPSQDQTQNVEYAHSNRSLPPPYFPIPESGFGAVGGFASAAINTARGWQDSSHLDFPGFRDRIVRVLQTKDEGGLNLFMDGTTINGLADRGRTAGQVMVEQFTQPHYPTGRPVPTATGWDNHRWVRYRALLSCLPAWLNSYARGREALDIDPTSPPSYGLTVQGRELARNLTQALDGAAEVIATADPDALTDLTEAPRPQGMIRRIPQT